MKTIGELVADIEKARQALLELLRSISPDRMAVPIHLDRHRGHLVEAGLGSS